MNEAETNRRRTALIDQQRSLRREMADLGADPDADEVAFDADTGFADRSHSTEERERVMTMARSLRMNLREVERAIKNIDDGSYGRCERCGDPIGEERLDAIPWAPLCIDCKKLVG
ncbi:MAG: TraR/DksA family transcriptional regulator [Acidobacteria bacterium]|nr:TraR/DksA family transcriptional regulator [Acidobacteriota bacterium]